MKHLALLPLAFAALSGCGIAEIGRSADGTPMVFETPRTIVEMPGYFLIMVRGNAYQIVPGDTKEFFRISAKTTPTFTNVSAPDDAGASDAVLHLASELGIGCRASKTLTAVPAQGVKAFEQIGDDQVWRKQIDCL